MKLVILPLVTLLALAGCSWMCPSDTPDGYLCGNVGVPVP